MFTSPHSLLPLPHHRLPPPLPLRRCQSRPGNRHSALDSHLHHNCHRDFPSSSLLRITRATELVVSEIFLAADLHRASLMMMTTMIIIMLIIMMIMIMIMIMMMMIMTWDLHRAFCSRFQLFQNNFTPASKFFHYTSDAQLSEFKTIFIL